MRYDISPQFGILRYVRSTLNPLVLRIAKLFLCLCPKHMNSNKDLDIKNIKIKTCDGKEIKTYLVTPREVAGELPVIFYFHGGAFVFKGAPHHYKMVKKYAKESKSAVIYVDYRLAYNSKFETPLNDCVDAYIYFVSHAHEFNLNTKRIAVAGDSAGGYLAVMTTIEAKKKNLPMPECQMLVYPVIAPNSKTESMQKFVDTPCWNAKLNKQMWKIYAKGNDVRNPLELGEEKIVSKSYIETAEFDCLHDEAVEYAKCIKHSGKRVILNETRRTIHGFDCYKRKPITKDAVRKRIEFLKESL